MPAKRSGPYSGYGSLPEAIEALRRGRFHILGVHQLGARGVVLEGRLVDGAVRSGMVLIPFHRDHGNVHVELGIESVEYLLHPGGIENMGLTLATTAIIEYANLAEGAVVDILEQSPAA